MQPEMLIIIGAAIGFSGCALYFSAIYKKRAKAAEARAEHAETLEAQALVTIEKVTRERNLAESAVSDLGRSLQATEANLQLETKKHSVTKGLLTKARNQLSAQA